MYCPKCGNYIPQANRFCPHCGAALVNDSTGYFQQPTTQTPSNQNPNNKQQGDSNAPLKSMAKSALLTPICAVAFALVIAFLLRNNSGFTLDTGSYLSDVFKSSVLGDVLFPLTIVIVILIYSKLKKK